jgi:retron-type reverse transcriptase
MRNVFELHRELAAGIYTHGGYHHFKISDPKPRDIHKASVRDRLLHHALYRKLYPFLDRTFIADSYSCREVKGTHKALNRFRKFARKVSKNDRRTVWVLKCDIRKFFASIDHKILFTILERYIRDEPTQALIVNIVTSFNSGRASKGLPLGNLTSQLLVNIYMNEFDQFVKHTLKAKYYIRYADDFVFLSSDQKWLTRILSEIKAFLYTRLKLELHPNKVFIKTLSSGVDFLGWVHFADYRVLRTATKRRMFRRVAEMSRKKEVVESYLGLLSHGNGYHLQMRVRMK